MTFATFDRAHFLSMAWPPSIRDVANGLARLRRWNGQTIGEWSVLQHVLLVHFIASKLSPNNTAIQLYSLWHDCEEVCSGDIPTPWKSVGQASLNDEIRRHIYEYTLKRQYPSQYERERVAIYDRIAAVNECHTFCHTRVRREIGGADLLDDEIIDEIWRLKGRRCQSRFVARTAELVLPGHRELL